MTCNYMRIGGVAFDLRPEFEPMVRKILKDFPPFIQQMEDLLVVEELRRVCREIDSEPLALGLGDSHKPDFEGHLYFRLGAECPSLTRRCGLSHQREKGQTTSREQAVRSE